MKWKKILIKFDWLVGARLRLNSKCQLLIFALNYSIDTRANELTSGDLWPAIENSVSYIYILAIRFVVVVFKQQPWAIWHFGCSHSYSVHFIQQLLQRSMSIEQLAHHWGKFVVFERHRCSSKSIFIHSKASPMPNRQSMNWDSRWEFFSRICFALSIKLK